MILDKRASFSEEQAITGNAVSTNVYDLGAPGQTYDGAQIKRKMGVAGMIPMLVQVTEDFDALTSLNIALESDDSDAFASAKVIFSVDVLLADLVAGYIIPIDKLPRKIDEQFLRFNYTVTGANPTVGKISAGFVAAVDGMNLAE